MRLGCTLTFELITTLVGVNSITLYYLGTQGRLAAEVFLFNQEQKVAQAFAHYSLLTESS